MGFVYHEMAFDKESLWTLMRYYGIPTGELNKGNI